MVTEANIEAFTNDGATVIRGLLGQRWLDLIGEGVEFNRTHPSEWSHWYTAPDEAIGFWTDYVTWRDVDQYRQVAFDSPLADAARALMGSDTVRFFHEHVLVKEPGAVERTPWHHDQPYYCLDGDQNASLWVALDPVPAASGMRFVAGSHRWDRWFVPRKFIDHSPYADAPEGFEIVPDIDAEIEAGHHRVVSFDVEPGDVIAFHYRTLHDAPGNTLGSRRRAVSFRWIGDDARFATRPWQVSPPYEADGLEVGGELGDDARFPIVPIG
ncbi:phytanoyl-CoA dioxygenase family protein [Ilumatobacter nonamiensis]|uniref:phytanoyl-CoA dioxygenase family protein n=1 Tax=Ilumatobacter nonamiensis TaxID=467093 RepID=UPI000348EEF7|nr:phytanoyl-CoA dioxygenase family protein [Ilumatobacter nonamiensis]